MAALTWVTCDGGPHLFIPSELVPMWRGIECTGNAPESDYQAACRVEGLIGLVRVGESAALVLGDEVPMSTWIPSRHFRGGIIVVPMEWPEVDEVSLLEAVRSVSPSSFEDAGICIPESSGMLVLCAAVDNGPDWLYPVLEVRLPAQAYRIASADVRTQGFWLRLHALLNVV